jgi:hypothetical protein
MAVRGRPFVKGNKASPGRPRGVKETVPRGFVKKLVFGVITGNVKQVEEALSRAAVNPRTVAAVLDHAAKLNKEIGSADAAGGAPTIINFYTNVIRFRTPCRNLLPLRVLPPESGERFARGFVAVRQRDGMHAEGARRDRSSRHLTRRSVTLDRAFRGGTCDAAS